MNKYTIDVLDLLYNIILGKEKYSTNRINLMKMILYFLKLTCRKNMYI